MTKSDLINVTFVNKDLSIKEMLLAIRNKFTIFMNKIYSFSLQDGS